MFICKASGQFVPTSSVQNELEPFLGWGIVSGSRIHEKSQDISKAANQSVKELIHIPFHIRVDFAMICLFDKKDIFKKTRYDLCFTRITSWKNHMPCSGKQNGMKIVLCIPRFLVAPLAALLGLSAWDGFALKTSPGRNSFFLAQKKPWDTNSCFCFGWPKRNPWDTNSCFFFGWPQKNPKDTASCYVRLAKAVRFSDLQKVTNWRRLNGKPIKPKWPRVPTS